MPDYFRSRIDSLAEEDTDDVIDDDKVVQVARMHLDAWIKTIPAARDLHGFSAEYPAVNPLPEVMAGLTKDLDN